MLDEPIETIAMQDLTISIHRDPDPMSPDEWDEAVMLATTYNRYFTVKAKTPQFGEIDATYVGEHRDEIEEYYHVFPLYMYAHSGVALSCTPFSCPWDSGRVGWVLVSKTDIGDSDPAEQAQFKVNEWNRFLSGEAYGFEVERDGELIDSCWGLDDIEYCEKEARAAAERELDDEQDRIKQYEAVCAI